MAGAGGPHPPAEGSARFPAAGGPGPSCLDPVIQVIRTWVAGCAKAKEAGARAERPQIAAALEAIHAERAQAGRWRTWPRARMSRSASPFFPCLVGATPAGISDPLAHATAAPCWKTMDSLKQVVASLATPRKPRSAPHSRMVAWPRGYRIVRGRRGLTDGSGRLAGGGPHRRHGRPRPTVPADDAGARAWRSMAYRTMTSGPFGSRFG